MMLVARGWRGKVCFYCARGLPGSKVRKLPHGVGHLAAARASAQYSPDSASVPAVGLVSVIPGAQARPRRIS